MTTDSELDLQPVLDRMGQGILIFDSAGLLIRANSAAHRMLGNDLARIRAKGWEAVSALFNARQTNPDDFVEAVRERSAKSGNSTRFHIQRSGEIIPCWVVAFDNKRGEQCTMVTLDIPDWSAMASLVDRFRDEMTEAVRATQGHIALIYQTIKSSLDSDVQSLSERVTGFARLIGIHMHRANRFLEMFERMEDIQLGQVKTLVQTRRRKIRLIDFLEDFVEELDEIMLVDPETEASDHRTRLTLGIKGDPVLAASSYYLTRILRDVLRNAIMYSIRATPVVITAHQMGQRVQVEVTDEGYGIRKSERDRVFAPFKRARQPQIIAEFGYGLSLYLCRHEVEAMNGRMWYESEEGVGSTFCIMLPAGDAVSSSSSSDTTTP